MTAARDRFELEHHHPAGMTCVVCIVAGIDVAPTEVQQGRLDLAELIRSKQKWAA